MNKSKVQAAAEVTHLLKTTRKKLTVNHNQNQQRILFDMLAAIDSASCLLDQAWKISKKHQLDDETMRKDFADMFAYFGKIKRDIKKTSKYSH